jgi:hypothetical protein
MKVLARIWRSLRGPKQDDSPSSEKVLELPVSPSVLSEVMIRARDKAEGQKVIRAIAQLQDLWGEDEPRLWLLARVEATYPHLVAMADAERTSHEWLTALSSALGAAADGVEEVEQEQERFDEILDKIEKARK